ncbi:MAG: sodium:proton antiporter [Lachnospiraceae bacterium]|nr:sodium:proton antiporter [Lachnospiraceae bacterium]
MSSFVCNFPFITILASLFSGAASSVIPGKWARRWNKLLLVIIAILSFVTMRYSWKLGTYYTYSMGHFPAPWGNEIRVGVLETFMAMFFSLLMLLCLMGGEAEREREIEESKQNLYYVLADLLISSLLSLIYTNDIFTAYVFVEINTLAACGLIMIRQYGRTMEAATRYLIMNLLGSGLFLLGICFLYDITGHLLMSNMRAVVDEIVKQGTYTVPLIISLGLMVVGLAIKTALYPFHAWVPDAYGYSTLSSSALLSALVSKGYVFLLIKIIMRVIGFDFVSKTSVSNVLFIYGLIGMMMGSINAIRQKDIRRMLAYSSVAQMGYIYMGLDLGTEVGIVAAIFHIISHMATKAMLFVAAGGLAAASGDHKEFAYLRGAAYRNKMAGLAFLSGALSMIGLPLFSGFISKLLFAQASMDQGYKMFFALAAIAISTILNTIYFMKAVMIIYTPIYSEEKNRIGGRIIYVKDQAMKVCVFAAFIAIDLVLGLFSEPIVSLLTIGIQMFG